MATPTVHSLTTTETRFGFEITRCTDLEQCVSITRPMTYDVTMIQSTLAPILSLWYHRRRQSQGPIHFGTLVYWEYFMPTFNTLADVLMIFDPRGWSLFGLGGLVWFQAIPLGENRRGFLRLGLYQIPMNSRLVFWTRHTLSAVVTLSRRLWMVSQLSCYLLTQRASLKHGQMVGMTIGLIIMLECESLHATPILF